MPEYVISRFIDLTLVLVTLFLGYFLGRLQERTQSKQSTLLERYNNLYWKFEHLFLSKTKGAFSFSELETNLQDDFFKVLIDGYCYADSELKTLITEFRWLYIDKISNELDDKFIEIARHMSDIEIELSKKLNMDTPSYLKESKKEPKRERM